MTVYAIVPATWAHCLALMPEVRAADRAEFLAASGQTPAQVLREGLSCSVEAWAGLADDEVCCVFGVAPGSLLTGSGIPWLVSGAGVDRHARAFVRRNRAVIERWAKVFPRLVNHVDARNTAAIRWLKWLGFVLEDAAPYGVSGLPFHRFEMKKGD